MAGFQTIGGVGGHGGDQGLQRFITVKCGGTVAKGNVVTWDGGDEDGIAVIACSATTPAVGVAQEAGEDGSYIRVQTHGIGVVAIASDGGVAADETISTHDSGAVDTWANTDSGAAVVGLSFVTDTGTAIAAGDYILFCGGSI